MNNKIVQNLIYLQISHKNISLYRQENNCIFNPVITKKLNTTYHLTKLKIEDALRKFTTSSIKINYLAKDRISLTNSLA